MPWTSAADTAVRRRGYGFASVTAILLLSHNAGYVHPRLLDAAGFALTAGLVLYHYRDSAPGWLWSIACTALLWFSAVYLRSSVATLGIISLLFFLIHYNTGSPKSRATALVFSCVSACYAIYLSLVENLAWFALMEESTSSILSVVAGFALPGRISLGPTYAGVRVTVAVAAFAICRNVLSGKSSPLFLARTLAIAAGINLIYIVIHGWTIILTAQQYTALRTLGLNSQMLVTILSLPFLTIDTASADRSGIHGQRLGIVCPVFAAIAIMAVTILPTVSSHIRNRTEAKHKPLSILFLDKGALDWRQPIDGTYGAKSGGMFGYFSRSYLPARGHTVTTDTSVTASSLNGIDILVIINPLKELGTGERRRICAFVRGGGALLAMGDHTGLDEIRAPLNDLLERFGIRLKFDSAIYFRKVWRYALQSSPNFIAPHEVLAGRSKVRIGASLQIRRPARAVLRGKFGFSDRGDILATKRGYLGDMRYRQGEHLGDLVLAASSKHGKGLVLAFGDTTPFQNSSLPYSYQFVDRVLDYLTANDHCRTSIASLFTVAITISLLCILLGSSGSGSSIPAFPSAALATVAAIAVALSADRMPSGKPIGRQRPLPARVAYIDNSHLPAINPECWEPSGMGGLLYNIMRSDYIPLVLYDFSRERILNCDILFLISSRKTFSKSQQSTILQFVDNGGLLIVADGGDCNGSLKRLLNSLSLEIRNVPLGRLGSHENSAHLNFQNAWALRSNGRSCEILSEAWGYPTVLRQSRGKGNVILIGDARFLLNSNLESVESYHPKNIEFLRRILREQTP